MGPGEVQIFLLVSLKAESGTAKNRTAVAESRSELPTSGGCDKRFVSPADDLSGMHFACDVDDKLQHFVGGRIECNGRWRRAT